MISTCYIAHKSIQVTLCDLGCLNLNSSCRFCYCRFGGCAGWGWDFSSLGSLGGWAGGGMPLLHPQPGSCSRQVAFLENRF